MLRFPHLCHLQIASYLLFASAARAEPHHVVVPDWPKLPAGAVLGQCAGVGVDSHHRVFVFHRNGRQWSSPFPEDPIPTPTVSILDGNTGELLASWGAGEFIAPHGLTLDQHDNVWLTDVGSHQVFQYTNKGQRLQTLGERGKPGSDQSHFNLPTDVAVLADGSFYVSDGYRNTRVVKFSADGKYQFEWGGKGPEPGHFNLPHGIAVDAHGDVFVCDRSNARLQKFDPLGHFLSEWKGPEIGRPYGVSIASDGDIYLIDGGDQSSKDPDRAKVVVLNAEGQVIESFGAPGKAAGQFQIGHDIAVDSDGSVYVAEVKGRRVQKFILKP